MSEPIPDPPPKRKIRISISRQRMVEFTVVVLGVLVALGLENLVQEARYRADARDLEQALASDIADTLFFAAERQAVAPCISEKLAAFSQHMDAAGEGPLAPARPTDGLGPLDYATPQAYRTPSRNWDTSAYERAIANESYKRIPAETARAYRLFYSQVDKQDNLNRNEFIAITSLAPLIIGPSIVSEEVRADLRRDLSYLDRHNTLMALVSQQLMEIGPEIPFVTEELRQRLRDEPEWIARSRTTATAAYGDCVDFTAADKLLSDIGAS